MIAIGAAIIAEALCLKIMIILGEIAANGDAKPCHLSGGAFLGTIWQARGIFKGGFMHAKGAGLACHAFGKFALCAGQMLRYHGCHIIRRFCHQGQDGIFNTNGAA